MKNDKVFVKLFPLTLVMMLNCSSNNNQNVSVQKLNVVDSIPSSKQNSVSTTIAFPSIDGLEITADEYFLTDSATWIILCHQAHWSRGEYLESALWFNGLGYNCLAIDQRSGESINGIVNETHLRAVENNIETSYEDARQDIEAAVEWVTKKTGQKVILLGSSYSSVLVLLVARNNPDIKAVISFSPGEYFDGRSITDSISTLDIPTWVTSDKSEASSVTILLQSTDSNYVHQFIPNCKGEHGSRVLWSEKPCHNEYQDALKLFLEKTSQLN